MKVSLAEGEESQFGKGKYSTALYNQAQSSTAQYSPVDPS